MLTVSSPAELTPGEPDTGPYVAVSIPAPEQVKAATWRVNAAGGPAMATAELYSGPVDVVAECTVSNDAIAALAALAPDLVIGSMKAPDGSPAPDRLPFLARVQIPADGRQAAITPQWVDAPIPYASFVLRLSVNDVLKAEIDLGDPGFEALWSVELVRSFLSLFSYGD